KHPLNCLAVKPRLALRDLAQAIDQQFRLDFAGDDAVDSATKQFEREFFVGFLGYHYHPKSGRLPQEFRDRFHRVPSKRGLQYQHVTSELLHRRSALPQVLALTYTRTTSLRANVLARPAPNDARVSGAA